jgi:hypothetical protein
MIVEHNNKNYLDIDCNLGTDIYKSLKENNLTDKIFEYICYNNHHLNGFMNLYNPPKIEGHV